MPGLYLLVCLGQMTSIPDDITCLSDYSARRAKSGLHQIIKKLSLLQLSAIFSARRIWRKK